MPIFELELNGPNLIQESERKGSARSLFWPWCGANVSLLALSYGAFFLGFGISFRQATVAAIIGTVLSFLVVGFSSLAGKKSNAPTMILSRATFGVKGNIVPGALSYLIFVGWETVLVSLATLATGTVFARLGNINHDLFSCYWLCYCGLTHCCWGSTWFLNNNADSKVVNPCHCCYDHCLYCADFR